jgi:enoyl-CoA hydratase
VIHTARDGGVLAVTLDRPERRNAVDHDTLLELADVIAKAQADRVRVLVLTGAGKTFCAGADLTGVESRGFADALRAVLDGLIQLPGATLAAVNGAALGAGCQLAIACDLRVAVPTAYFGVPASRLGLMVDPWTVQRVAELAGGSRARSILLAAENLHATEAHAAGFVHRLGDLEGAMAWARDIAGLAPLSVAGHKLALERRASPSVDPEVLDAMHHVWASADAAEGRTAFLEKRPAMFEGR